MYHPIREDRNKGRRGRINFVEGASVQEDAGGTGWI